MAATGQGSEQAPAVLKGREKLPHLEVGQRIYYLFLSCMSAKHSSIRLYMKVLNIYITAGCKQTYFQPA